MSRGGSPARPHAIVALAFGLAGMVSLAACGRDAAIPATALPEEIASFGSLSSRELDTSALAAEAIDHEALAALLETAGFRAAIERTYTRPDPTLRRIEILLARFASNDGAERFFAWQREHAADVIGEAEPASELSVHGTTTFVHRPDGCCPKEQVTALVVWQRGPDVIRVLLTGPDADTATTADLVSTLFGELPLAA